LLKVFATTPQRDAIFIGGFCQRREEMVATVSGTKINPCRKLPIPLLAAKCRTTVFISKVLQTLMMSMRLSSPKNHWDCWCTARIHWRGR
jgi:hypothetical protein